MAATLPEPTAPNYHRPTYRSNGACDDLAALVFPAFRAQLAGEATGIADEAAVNSWIEHGAIPPRSPRCGCSRAPRTTCCGAVDETTFPTRKLARRQRLRQSSFSRTLRTHAHARVVAETLRR